MPKGCRGLFEDKKKCATILEIAVHGCYLRHSRWLSGVAPLKRPVGLPGRRLITPCRRYLDGISSIEQARHSRGKFNSVRTPYQVPHFVSRHHQGRSSLNSMFHCFSRNGPRPLKAYVVFLSITTNHVHLFLVPLKQRRPSDGRAWIDRTMTLWLLRADQCCPRHAG